MTDEGFLKGGGVLEMEEEAMGDFMGGRRETGAARAEG